MLDYKRPLIEDIEGLSQRVARLRIFSQTLEPDARVGNFSYLGYRYLEAFTAADISVRLISTVATDFQSESSAWFIYRSLLLTAMPNKLKFNFVVGPPSDLVKFYTDDTINIGITMPKPRQPNEEELAVMIKYEKIIAPTWNIFDAFDKHVIQKCRMFVVRPEPENLTTLMQQLNEVI